MYKVFFNDREVYLTDDKDHLFIQKKGMFYPYQSFTNLKEFMDKFHKNLDIQQVYIYHHDLEKLIVEFKSLYIYLETAGGLVYNQNNQVLFIKRFGKWDLPKGKLKKGETTEQGAKREVEEECGISNVVVKDSLCTTYHTYTRDDKIHLKKNHWFTMYYEGDEELVPQEEEGVEFAKWYETDDLKSILENTYPSIIDVLKMADIVKKIKKPRFN